MDLLTRPRGGVRDARSAEPLQVQLRETLRAEIEERGPRPWRPRRSLPLRAARRVLPWAHLSSGRGDDPARPRRRTGVPATQLRDRDRAAPRRGHLGPAG